MSSTICSDYGALALGFDPTKVVPSAEDYVKLVDKVGKNDATSYVLKQQELLGRILTAHYKTASSSGSSGSCGSVKSLGSLRGLAHARKQPSCGRSAAIQGLPSWRAGKQIADGYCYARMLNGGAATQELMRLKTWPSIGSILSTPITSFVSLDDLRKVKLTKDEAGLVHVDVKGNGYSATDVMGSIASGRAQKKGTLGAVLKAGGYGASFSLPDGFSSAAPLGGTPCTSLYSHVPRDAAAVLAALLRTDVFVASCNPVKSLVVEPLACDHGSEVVLVANARMRDVVRQFGVAGNILTLQESQGATFGSVVYMHPMGAPDLDVDQLCVLFTRFTQRCKIMLNRLGSWEGVLRPAIVARSSADYDRVKLLPGLGDVEEIVAKGETHLVGVSRMLCGGIPEDSWADHFSSKFGVECLSAYPARGCAVLRLEGSAGEVKGFVEEYGGDYLGSYTAPGSLLTRLRDFDVGAGSFEAATTDLDVPVVGSSAGDGYIWVEVVARGSGASGIVMKR